ncbi:Predicted arabinose efflux permease, MFS family [Cohnella sp. OV330]|uniref:MFS transporter n=1 Tax=Cohnella sp. OV330 TaxID=1855288 RepID=UPI0008EB7540|nr:Predicted arabinose efflux permease, MFS family [Cohnella sp. OV330]
MNTEPTNKSVSAKTDNAQADSPAPQAPMLRSTKLLFAVSASMTVSTIYYAQPLLADIAESLHIARSSIGEAITVTQLFYALGLLLLVPLGDLLNRRTLIAAHLAMSAAALAVTGVAHGRTTLYVGLAAVGLLAVATQSLVAFASILAAPGERGRVVGFVTSGVVIGILLARTFAGLLARLGDWHLVYLISASLMALLSVLAWRTLPNAAPRASNASWGSYRGLIRSMPMLFIQEKLFRIRAAFAFFIFAAFSLLWTSLSLPLSDPPFSYSPAAIGAFGLAGAAGALGAAGAGRLADRGYQRRTTGGALALLLASWLPIAMLARSPLLLIAGIVLLDLAVQAVHVTNQSLLFSLRPEARNRVTAGYMIFYSLGSGAGSLIGTHAYAYSGWSGVCWAGGAVSGAALLFWALAGSERGRPVGEDAYAQTAQPKSSLPRQASE